MGTNLKCEQNSNLNKIKIEKNSNQNIIEIETKFKLEQN
jgi:hypothetical protein